jgi:hypothetical protein
MTPGRKNPLDFRARVWAPLLAAWLVVQFGAQAEHWATNQVLVPNVPGYPFAGIYHFDNLTVGDDIEVTSSNVTHLVLKVEHQLILGSNFVIRVRNGNFPGTPKLPIAQLTAADLADLGTMVDGCLLFSNLFGQGGRGGNGLSAAFTSFNSYHGSGGGGGGGFGGGEGGRAGYAGWYFMAVKAWQKPGAGNGGYDAANGGDGGNAGYIEHSATAGIAAPGGQGGNGGDGWSLGEDGTSTAGVRWTPRDDYVFPGGGGGGGNGGRGGSVAGPNKADAAPTLTLVNAPRSPHGGAGGGGGGYGGGVLTIIADTIAYPPGAPPRLLVCGQQGGAGGAVSGDSQLTGTRGDNGEGGLLIIQSRDYPANRQHWDLGTNVVGSHLRSAKNGGHGMITGAPQQALVFPPPQLTITPESSECLSGDIVQLRVVASGTAPLNYQWWFEDSPLAGATSDVLNLTGITLSQSGSYYVVAGNLAGSVASSSAVIKVYAGTIDRSSLEVGPLGGAFKVGVTANPGQPWAVANSNSWIDVEPNSEPATGSNQETLVVAPNPNQEPRTGLVEIAGRTLFVRQASADRSAPTVAINSPAANTVLNTDQLTMTGAAADNGRVSRVECQVNGGPWLPTQGTTNWETQLILVPGTNEVQVRSIDWAENNSPIVTWQLVCTLIRPINLSATEGGSVRGLTNGQLLVVGRDYSVVASAKTGFLFAGWIGSVSGAQTNLNFRMQSNTVIQARFVANPFPNCKGTYTGLFATIGRIAPTNSGAIAFTLTDTGRYSGTIKLSGASLSLAGQFDWQGRSQISIARSPAPPVTVALALNLGETDQVAGTVSSQDWTALAEANRSLFDGITNKAPFVGRYAIAFAGGSDPLTTPIGYGCGTVTVDAKGMMILTASLADGTALSVSSSVARNGTWPLFAPLYQGQGMVLGWMAISNGPSLDIYGTNIIWIKPAQNRAAYYPSGFALAHEAWGNLLGTNRWGNGLAGQIVFQGGNLGNNQTNLVVKKDNQLVATGGDSNKMTLYLTESTGALNGYFQPPWARQTVAFKGAMLPKERLGLGYFLGTNQSGRIELNFP